MSQLESVIPLLESLVLDWTANRRDSLRARNRRPKPESTEGHGWTA